MSIITYLKHMQYINKNSDNRILIQAREPQERLALLRGRYGIVHPPEKG